MCRLFGMSGGRQRVRATFWLLEAPDSLSRQSRRDPDGTGLGCYDEQGHPEVFKAPLAAYEDRQFAEEAREVCSRTFVAHVRYASTGKLTRLNTHPFQQRERLFAHNGVIEDLPQLERELGPAMRWVKGETDSERFFALITRETEEGQDVGQAIRRAASWVAEHLPVFALNLVLITGSELWALRYPDVHELHVLERDAGGARGGRHLDQASARGTIRVRSGDLASCRAVVVASERMDEHPEWRALEPGELLHVDADLKTTITRVIDGPPVHQLTLEDLGQAAASQASTPAGESQRS
ncbi:MAG TPA: class II glutamine amidotransferase [Solirubrobacteraceae bacterium]|nr:class II glutamine amidotransferase [Solirubrobacteraceae bacterium]